MYQESKDVLAHSFFNYWLVEVHHFKKQLYKQSLSIN